MTVARFLRAALFDWDGTIIDSSLAMWLSYRYAYRTYLGIDFPDNEADLRLLSPMRIDESSAKYGGRYASEIARSYSEYYVREAYRAGSVFVGITNVLQELRRRGYQLGVASNKSKTRINADMEFLGLRHYFDAFATSEDTVERKPDPAPLLKLATKLHVAPQECAYIGDYPGDIIAAKAAQMMAVAVLWGNVYEPAALLAEEPDQTVRQPQELLSLFPPRQST
jgi:HAD superfamily hydrolase (TIGR01509 family)